MSSVALESVSKIYPGGAAVQDLDLEIAAGGFVVLLGPSGCGKTTTLRMIAGFVEPTQGRVLIGGRDVTRVPPRHRDIGMVFQNYALFPNMTVAQNIGFGLRHRGADRARIRRRVDEMLELIHLEGKGDSYADELSGGQQQRVALARALAASPQLLLMDEPLGALDQKLRENLQVELLRIQRELGITTVLVTHDQQEAMVLADRIVVMAGGRIQQAGTPRELYRRPANAFVADFMGKNNLMQGRGVGAAERLEIDLGSGCRMPLPAGACRGGEDLRIGVRPEQLDVGPVEGACIPATVEEARFLGNVAHYFLRTPWGQQLLAERFGGDCVYPAGSVVGVRWKPGDVVVLDGAGARHA